jgi:hypothetical protein
MLRHFDRERLIWDAAICPTQKLVLLAINQFLGANDCCWPAIGTIAKMTGYNERTVTAHINQLVAKGMVIKIPRRNEMGMQISNNYRLNWQKFGGDPGSGRDDLNAPPENKDYSDNNENLGVIVDQGGGDRRSPDLIHRSNSINKREREEREAPRSPLPHQKFVEAQFVVEQTPWMKAGDLNSIDPGFVKFVQDELKGLGPYEKKAPTEANAKDHIRRYMRVPRGTEERQAIHAAIFDKWTAYKAQPVSPEVLSKAIRAELDRLNMFGVIPNEFKGAPGAQMVSDLTIPQKVEYLAWLKGLRHEYAA